MGKDKTSSALIDTEMIETLREQLKLLTERARGTKDPNGIAVITEAMCAVFDRLNSLSCLGK